MRVMPSDRERGDTICASRMLTACRRHSSERRLSALSCQVAAAPWPVLVAPMRAEPRLGADKAGGAVEHRAAMDRRKDGAGEALDEIAAAAGKDPPDVVERLVVGQLGALCLDIVRFPARATVELQIGALQHLDAA